MSTVTPVRMSFGVLRNNRRLLVFPLLSATALVLILGALAVSAFLLDGAESSPSTVDVVASGACYLLLGFAFTICTAAMICAVDDVLRGESARIGASFRRALRHWPRLLAWSLLNTTVLLLVRQLERIPVVGWMLSALFSNGWAVATYLALPAMVVDGLGVAEGTRRSARMVRETFSRQVWGSLWIALPMVLSVIVGFVAFMLGVESNDLGPAVAGGAFAVVMLLGALLVGATVSGIFRTALYRDAAATA
ncbi:DUF6159 family protein [Streptomyces sp. H39-S7]|uniref:DUF6159 family protein n=1 Tax=Streptomyces sp. H39-S7 TaxID=3004357 RepID=UPI0022AFA8BA|nr:DUF6159 family protein [Streptomyces sp. H39-S7]MCZ4123857.1 DUF6159 family protein [Streptomyces sp. H39-S7]